MLGRRPLAPLALVSWVLACTPSPAPTPTPSAAASAKAEPAKAEPAKTEPAKTEPALEPAKTEPTPEPAPTGLPPSDLVQLPLYWAQLRDGKIEFDAHDISQTEYEPIRPLEFDDSLVLEAGDVRIPARFAYGQTFVVASEAGRVNAKVERVTLTMGDGISMVVTLAPDGPLEAKQGMLVFASATAPVDAKIRLPERLADSEPVFAKLLESVNAALKKRRLPKAVASELRVHPVTLQGALSFIVAVQVFDGKDPEETDSSEIPTGLALADANGKIVEWLRPLEVELEAYEVQLVLDLDGDGLDELIYLASYHEGAFWHLLRLDPTDPNKYTSLEIAGAGL